MILETVILNNKEYYQFKFLDENTNKYCVGSLFENIKDIKFEREKMEYWQKTLRSKFINENILGKRLRGHNRNQEISLANQI